MAFQMDQHLALRWAPWWVLHSAYHSAKQCVSDRSALGVELGIVPGVTLGTMLGSLLCVVLGSVLGISVGA